MLRPLAKALSGGFISSGAVLMSGPICASVYTSFKRAIIHTSTHSENALSIRAVVTALSIDCAHRCHSASMAILVLTANYRQG